MVYPDEKEPGTEGRPDRRKERPPALRELEGEIFTLNDHVTRLWRYLDVDPVTGQPYEAAGPPRTSFSLTGWIRPLFGRVASLENRAKDLPLQTIQAAHEKARVLVEQSLQPVWHEVRTLRDDLNWLRERVDRHEQALAEAGRRTRELDRDWQVLRAERVRNDTGIAREQDAVHHVLAPELVKLGTQRMRAVVRHLQPVDPHITEGDLTRFRAGAVRRGLQACLSGSAVDSDAVRSALYQGTAGPLHDFGDQDLRRLLETADRLRAKIAGTGGNPHFDFDLPEAGAEFEVWNPCPPDAPPRFVVVPGYRVGSLLYNAPVVYTAEAVEAAVGVDVRPYEMQPVESEHGHALSADESLGVARAGGGAVDVTVRADSVVEGMS